MLEKTGISIAIDGPAAAGKSTIAKAISQELGFLYVDTGALYRAIGYYAHTKGVTDTKDSSQINPLLVEINVALKYIDGIQRIFINEVDVSDEIRGPEMSMAASNVSAIPEVRAFLLDLQRDLAKKYNVVMDGRDIGTVVLPNATIKIFLTATAEARTTRRWKEYKEKGQEVDFNTLLEETKQRDYNDSNRAAAPLKQAEDAFLFDSTDFNFEETLNKLLEIIKEKI